MVVAGFRGPGCSSHGISKGPPFALLVPGGGSFFRPLLPHRRAPESQSKPKSEPFSRTRVFFHTFFLRPAGMPMVHRQDGTASAQTRPAQGSQYFGSFQKSRAVISIRYILIRSLSLCSHGIGSRYIAESGSYVEHDRY